MRLPFVPESIRCLRRYDARTFAADLVAGVTVGLVALPLAMAFAIASGLPPRAGLTCAVIAGFLISALGGSRVQIGGPTGAFVVVVSGIVLHHGVDGLFMCTLMAGVILIALGVTQLGTAVDFIPRPVIVGFTNGIAVLIASTQVKDFLGLDIARPAGEFPTRMAQLARALPTVSWPTALLGLGALASILIVNRAQRRVPGTIVALLAGTAAATLLALPVETVGTRFGGLPSGWPPLAIPTFRPDLIHPLLGPAVTVAMLGAIESLLSAVVADRMIGTRHDPNTELVAQGVANVVSPLFGGLPATGAIARTATNVRSGGRTPVAGMVHAVTLLAILLWAAPLARFVPLGVLAAILLVVAWNMGDWEELPALLRLSRTDASVWLVTFGLTVFADLTVAVEAGMILAALLFISRIAATTTVTVIDARDVEALRPHTLVGRRIPDGVLMLRVHGPFLFGATEKLERALEEAGPLPAVVVLRLRHMTAIDGTALHAIETLARRLHADGRTLILEGLREQPARFVARSALADALGRDNVCASIERALERAAELTRARPAAGAA